MAVTPSTFKARFPEFTGILDARVQVYIDEAVADLDQGVWGDTTTADRATSFLVAHRLAVELDSTGTATTGQVGALTAAAADGVSSSYAMPEGLSAADLAFWTTTYGQRFMELRERFLLGVMSVG